MDFVIRPAEVADARGYARAREEGMVAAYQHFMPAAFFEQREADFEASVASFEQQFTERARVVAEGGEPFSDYWVGERDGRVIGMCTVSRGTADWEREMGFPPAPIARQLSQLYTVPEAHGSGLGQALLDTALLPEHGAYLWVLHHNPRAERFYLRNGFVPEGLDVECGPSWFHARMFRMWRPDRPADA